MKYLIIFGTLAVFFSSQSMAQRERVLSCPGEVKPRKSFALGNIAWDNHVWTIAPKGFSGASIQLNPPAPAILYCYYGETNASIEIPKEYSGRTCSFALEEMKPECETAEVKDCVVYCEKRAKK